MTRPKSIVFPAMDAAAELFRRGLAAHQQGELVTAAEFYQQVLRALPSHADSLHLLGVIAHQTRHSALAVEQISRAIALDPAQAHYYYNLGTAQFALGQYAEAIAAFRQALRLRHDYPEVHYNLGNALREQGQVEQAVESFRRALRHRPNFIEAYNNLGNCLKQLGRPERAEAAFRRALRIAPEAAELHNNLGLALQDMGRTDEAATCFETALRLRPDFLGALENLAAATEAQGRAQAAIALRRRPATLRPDDPAAHEALAALLHKNALSAQAADSYQAALRIDPDRSTALLGLAEAYRRLDRPEEAEPLLRRLLSQNPDSADAYNDLANALHDLGRHAEAISLYRHALTLRSDFAAARCNLANVLKATRDDTAAEAEYRAALTLDPDHADAHAGLGMLLLRGGRLEEGWAEAEWRFRCASHILSFAQRTLPRPRWDGAKLDGRTLLVHAEQGYGDSIHFCRYVPEIAQHGRVVLEVPKALVRLMSSLSGADAIVPYGETLPDFDVHCPMLSLPLAARTTLATIPASVPYLHVAPAAVDAWRRRLEPLEGLHVGLAWAGNPQYPNDRWRSARLERLAPLARVPGVSFVSLQKGPASSQAATPPAGMVLHDWTEEFSDFADTAALIGALDLVISTDTSVVHLAGALGKPVWLLRSYDACWRWLLDRDDSPWYPKLRQFRQPRLGDWETPVAGLCAALHAHGRERWR